MANKGNGVRGKRRNILRRRVKDNNSSKNINNLHSKPQPSTKAADNPGGVSGPGQSDAQNDGLSPGNQTSRGVLQEPNSKANVARKNSFQPRKPTHRRIGKTQNENESPGQLKKCLESMLADVNRSEESRRAVIEYLATEDGLSRVKRTVETKYSVGYSVTTPMFDPHCLLFLRVIAHKDALRSLVVEKPLGTIYNVVYGLNGNRGVSFFQHVMDYVKQTLLPTENDDQKKKDNGLWQLMFVTEALLHLLTVNQAAVLRPEFKAIVNDLTAAYIYHQQSATERSMELRQTYRNINKVADILEIGDRIEISEPRKHHPTSQQPELVDLLRVDFPGDLSDVGRRHDNDHAAIQEVHILPTLSEIYSQRSDFLPTRDSCKLPGGHHREGIRRLLDTQFRLLREDTSGVLRDAVRIVIENWNIIVHGSDWTAKSKILRQKSPTPVRIYYAAQVRQSTGSGVKGIEMEVEFDQPQRIKRLSPDKRRKYWLNSRSLREGGGPVALIDAEVEDDTNVVFLQVSNRDLGGALEPAGVVRDVVSDVDRAMVTLRFPTTPSKEDLSCLVQMSNSYGAERPLILVEFPAVQYNQFEGILRCLQELDRNPSRIPFRKWLQAGVGNPITGRHLTELPDARIAIPPPLYLNGAMLDLSSIQARTDDNESNTPPLILSSMEDPQSVQRRLCQSSTLDAGQAEAMVSALTHELALIQGPPGTGKSYVGIQLAKCFLDNKDRLGLGPLLCVCYTNHALDQFLGELEAFGVRRILRIGSHSPSPLMESFSLSAYKNRGSMSRARGLGKKIRDSKAALDDFAARITRVLKELGQGSLFIAHAFLTSRHPQYEEQIREGQSAGCEQLKTWLSGNGPGDLDGNGEERSIDQLLSAGPWTLTHIERSRLHEYFYNWGTADRLQLLEHLIQAHAREKRLHTSIFTEMDSQIFDQVDVVGVTTTGLANNSDLLRTLRAKVLICEEAGEVLESHLLTALLPSVEHAIFIGDHLQLRPKISRRYLSMESDSKGPKYNLDESLFERLAGTKLQMAIRGSDAAESVEFPVAQLNNQRRMHPSIASLIRKQLYPNLQDYPSTSLYPEVAGIKRRLFWLDHENIEDPGDPEDPMQSRTNRWEAQMVTALVAHLCRQGKYRRGEIAVLTPYVAQLKLLKEMLENIVDLVISDGDLADLGDLEDDAEDLAADKGRIMKGSLSDQVRMATVDNFQGEEANIVIVSLVRSNWARQCGFLKTPNRINVLLSRAKHGMYIIGNAQTSCHVPMWKSVIEMLEAGSNIGRTLELQCPRHANGKAYVSSPDDFPKFAPEGGCFEQCGLRLKCGHTCTFKCHSNKLHSAAKCMEACTVMRNCGHACQKKCHEICGDCTEVIPDVTLPCGHTAQVQCRDRERLTSLDCPVSVTRTLSCGHQVQAPCSKAISSVKCTNPCRSPRPCGHDCRNECWKCQESGKHGKCTAPCGRQYTTCVHSCLRPCHVGDCPPCRLPCEVRCVHSRCPRKCSDPCTPCSQSCGWSCIHREQQCNLPCAVPCEIVPCTKRCGELLRCGHRCPGICGERCPDSKLCHECGSKEVLERLVDLVMFQKYADIDVDEDPVVFLSCGHFFTRFTMDGIMAITEHYEAEPTTQELIRPKSSRRTMTSSAAPTCPECRGSVRDIHRYNRIVKKALLDESTRRFVVKANRNYITVLKAVQMHEEALEEHGSKLSEWLANNPFDNMAPAQVQQSLNTYEATDRAMRKRVQKFVYSVRKTEQPLDRVNELLASAAARVGAVGINEPKGEETAILTGFSIRGECLFLRLTWVILWETERICKNPVVPFDTCSVLRGKVRNQLPELLEKCHAVRGQSSDGRFLAEKVQATLYQVLVSQLFLNCIATEAEALQIPPALLSRNKIKESLEECEALYLSHLGTLGHLKDDIEKAKRFCDGQPFYTSVTTEERREVYEAMAAQFQGTGHWYYCRNNHPFTIGDCGMPMEEARCPQCGERIGGHDHEPMAGVRRAQDIDAEFGTA